MVGKLLLVALHALAVVTYSHDVICIFARGEEYVGLGRRHGVVAQTKHGDADEFTL